MIKQKRKQQKKQARPNANLLRLIEQYHSKIKSKHFEIFLNQGINEYEKLDNYTYRTTLSMGHFQQLLENTVKCFSSLYKMDHKTFQWTDKIQSLIESTKEIIKIIDKVKHQMKKINQVIAQNEQLTKTNEELQNSNKQLRNECKKVNTNNQLLKVKEPQLQLQNKQKNYLRIVKQTQQKLRHYQQNNNKLKAQNNLLKERLTKGISQNNDLKAYLKKIYDSSFDENMIAEVRAKTNNINFEEEQIVQLKQKQNLSFQKDLLLNDQISSILVAFLPPQAINNLCALSKSTRFFLLHSPKVNRSIFRSINGFKNYQISFFHRHIEHFQKLLKKIPQEIIQSTFYQYNILKEQIGGDFLSVLNLCGNIFQGKMNPINSQGGRVVKQYLDAKEIIHHVIAPKQEEMYLQVEKQLMKQFFQQRKGRKQSIMQEIESMTSKLSLTQSLYSVDEASSKQFYQNIIKYFTILFVLSKYLFSESRNLQYLNNFLLGELNEITKFKIEKQYDLEDIQAELQSSTKMNQFLSDKCNKSEQRILRQTKELLETQKIIVKLNQMLKQLREKQQKFEREMKIQSIELQKSVQKNNQLKGLYNASKDKYNRLLNELNIVKETILKIK